MTQSWLGLSLDFTNTEDKTSESTVFELLKEGFYRATIKSVNKSVLGANNKPALTITLTLDDHSDRELVHNLFLPEVGDSESAINFKKENLRNFFSRFVYRNITKAEFDKLTADEVNKSIEELCIKQQPSFAGAKMLVHIKQEPFISRDRETKAIKWAASEYNANICTKPILKLIQDLEQKGVDVKTFPVILFSNKVAAHGFGFYGDYNEGAELKNSKSYDLIQSLNANTPAVNNSDDTVEEVAF